jgi:hypothetical protein
MSSATSLISNLDLDVREDLWSEIKHLFRVAMAAVRLVWTLGQIHEDTPPAQATATFRKAAPALMSASKCPDYIVNRGHYFGTQYAAPYAGVRTKALSDQDKEDLIAFLKTF